MQNYAKLVRFKLIMLSSFLNACHSSTNLYNNGELPLCQDDCLECLMFDTLLAKRSLQSLSSRFISQL